MSVDRERLNQLAEDDDYPAVVGGDTAEEYALDHAYAAVDEQVTDDEQHEELTMIPAQYLRGTPDKQEVEWILQDLERMAGHIDEIAQSVEEAREFL